MATTPLALSVIRPPLVDDLTQTGDDSPQFSPRFWACRFGIADGRKSPFDCRLVCVRTRPLVCD
jgi:hypothetical protein